MNIMSICDLLRSNIFLCDHFCGWGYCKKLKALFLIAHFTYDNPEVE